MSNLSLFLSPDAYKLGHILQYPDNTEFVYSNFTPRSARHLLATQPEGLKDDTIVAVGMYNAVREIQRMFQDFLKLPPHYVEEKLEPFFRDFAPDTTLLRSRIKQLRELGYLPLVIKALPEGTLVKPNTPVLTIYNTHNDFAWLVNYLEDVISNLIWKPMVAATIARSYRQLFMGYANLTGSPKEFVDFQGHDFSVRGMGGPEDARRSGMGHLTQFVGTDNIGAAAEMHDAFDVIPGILVGASIPATEHSVMCAGGKDNEFDTYHRLITKIYPSGMVSIVSDTWDFFGVLTDIASALKSEIMNRDGKVVFRPDSGDPVDIIAGTARVLYPEKGEYICDQEPGIYIVDNVYYQWAGEYFMEDPSEPITNVIAEPTPQMKGAVEVLWGEFGGTTTDTGHKLLDEHVGLIYGDSITLERAYKILAALERKGFASANIVFGIGSYTYQYITRDTIGAAMKATYAVVDGEGRELEKSPITDATKKSRCGLLRVDYDGTVYDGCTWAGQQQGMLEIIFEDSVLNPKPELGLVRRRARS